MDFFISLIFLTSKNVVLIYISSYNLWTGDTKDWAPSGSFEFAPCKGIQDSLGFCIVCRGFGIPGTGFQSLSVELGFWIPISSGIPDSLSFIPDSKAHDSRFHRQCFSRILYSTRNIFLDSGSGFSYIGRFQQKNRYFWLWCLLPFITGHLYLLWHVVLTYCFWKYWFLKGYIVGRVALGSPGKMLITTSFDSVYVFSAELFPTVVRWVIFAKGKIFKCSMEKK